MENASQSLKPKEREREREIEEKRAREYKRVLFFVVVWPLTSLFRSLRKTEEDRKERKCVVGKIAKISLTHYLIFPKTRYARF